MFSNDHRAKIDEMFDKLIERANDTIANSLSREDAARKIVQAVSSETAARSKTMLVTMCGRLSDEALAGIQEVENKNKFYRADLQSEITDKYSFEGADSLKDYKDTNRAAVSSAAGGSIAAVGIALSLALAPSSPIVPIAIVVAVSLSAFCVSYFKIVPQSSRNRFAAAVSEYLKQVKDSYVEWLDNVENYYRRRVEEIKSSFGE